MSEYGWHPTEPRAGRNMTEEQYRQYPAVNKSTLWEMRRSPAHYKWALEHPTEDTPALAFGRACHMALLQPTLFLDHYRLAPNCDRRTKAGKDEYNGFIQGLRADQEPISAEDYATVMGMMESISKSRRANELLRNATTELPVFWTDDATGIECKCRLDAIIYETNRDGTPAGIVVMDLKTCADASTNAFMREALKYGYDVQAAHYIRGVKHLEPGVPVRWCFLAVEKKEPYCTNLIWVGDDFIDRGTWQLIDFMGRLKECRETDTWPGYGENTLVLPEWAAMPEEE